MFFKCGRAEDFNWSVVPPWCMWSKKTSTL
ncbi:hypothetical protein PR048_023472 [Dryococelus australis]|uniref:Uncharacterized protein n=1 Tax=Dryococelus australis TaxID=614101 RepID=A0ABQ9GU57_9NEOP|nr:hypothetical protein PR048_023472 [Dryococelus australis]